MNRSVDPRSGHIRSSMCCRMRRVMLSFALWAAFALPSTAMVLPHAPEKLTMDDAAAPRNALIKALLQPALSILSRDQPAEVPAAAAAAESVADVAAKVDQKTWSEQQPSTADETLAPAAKTETPTESDDGEEASESDWWHSRDKKYSLASQEGSSCELLASATLMQVVHYAVCRQVEAKPGERVSVERKADGSGYLIVVNHIEDFNVIIKNLDQNELFSFEYCNGLKRHQCRAVLLLLEQIVESQDLKEQLYGVDDIPEMMPAAAPAAGAAVPGSDADAVATTTLAVVRRRRRRRRSVDDERRLLQVLERYRKWRKNNGYGKSVGRWGRDVSARDVGARDVSARDVTAAAGRRVRRGAGTPADMWKMVQLYKQWRKRNGYGIRAGRWGR